MFFKVCDQNYAYIETSFLYKFGPGKILGNNISFAVVTINWGFIPEAIIINIYSDCGLIYTRSHNNL